MSWRVLLVSTLAAGLITLSSLASAATQTFSSPSVRGVRLDWCAHFGTGCGQPAADLFCRENGFTSAGRFSIDANIGRRGVATLVFGDGRLCSGPDCSGFRAITCTKVDAAVPGPVGPVAPSGPAVTVNPGLILKPIVRQPPVIRAPPPTRPSRPPVVVRPPTVTAVPTPPPRPATSGASGTTSTLAPIASIRPGNLLLTYPDGANLYHCTSGCEFRLDSDITIDPDAQIRTVNFTGDVKKIPRAGGFFWEVTTAPFPAFGKGAPSDFSPPHLVASGEFGGAAHDISVDFGTLGSAANAHTPPPGIFYVRILPIVAAGVKALAGTPSNIIRVYYGQKPPPQPPLHLPNTNPPYLFDVKVISFTPPDFEDPNRWGCVIVTGYAPGTSDIFKSAYPVGEHCPAGYKGAGHDITSVGDFVDLATGGLTDLWGWVSEKYNGLKKLAVDIAMNYTPFGLQCKAMASAVAGSNGADYCRAAAEIGVNAGMAALGLPPSIPNYNQLVDQGVDAAVDLAADQITQQTGIPCVGPCQDALHNGLSAAADNLKKSNYTPGCVGTDEAHQHGAEPLCLPAGVLAKPAPRAIYQPPVAMLSVTRTQYDRDPTSLFSGPCYASIDVRFKNIFPAQTVWGPFHNTKDVPTSKIEGPLYSSVSTTLPESMPKGSTKLIPVVFQTAMKYEFGWTRTLWEQSEIPARDSLGPMGPDWFTLYSGSTASVSSGLACGRTAGAITSQMPKLF